MRAFHDDVFADLESFADDPVRTDALGRLDRAHINFIAFTDNRDQIFALNFRDCTLRYEQGVLFDRNRGADLAKQPRAEIAIFVREDRAQLEGPGGGVDLAVKQDEFSSFRVYATVR